MRDIIILDIGEKWSNNSCKNLCILLARARGQRRQLADWLFDPSLTLSVDHPLCRQVFRSEITLQDLLDWCPLAYLGTRLTQTLPEVFPPGRLKDVRQAGGTAV